MNHLLLVLGANYLLFACPLLLCIAWCRAPQREKGRVFLQACATVGLAVLLGRVAGKVHYQERPFMTMRTAPLLPHKESNGFPSHHALFAFACAFATLRPSWRLAGMSFVAATANGACRVVALIHTPWQIAAGALTAAIAWLAVDILAGLKRARPRAMGTA